MPSVTTDRRQGLTADKGMRAPVALATTGNILLSGEQSVDGATTALSRVLVKNQTDSTQNGIYDSSTGTWTRSIDANGNNDFAKGQLLVVTGGGQAGTYWRLTTDNPITLGSTAITFTQDFLNTLASTLAARPLQTFGTLANDGVTDDSATWIAASVSGVRCIDARGLNPKIASTINIPANQTWLLEGTKITISSSTLTVFNCDTVNDWNLLGAFRITGAGSTVGTAKGIRIKDCARGLVDTPILNSIQGWGIYIEPGANTTTRGTHTTILNPVIYDCYYGYEDTPGTGAEYCTIFNPRITTCTSHGLKSAAGNTLINGGHIVDNTAIGVYLVNGSNSGHGVFTGTNINHNGTYDIQAVQVTNGFTFDGCHIYQGDVWFDRCKGMQIDGGHFDPAHVYNYKDGSSGMNRISHAYFPGGYGPVRTVGSNDGHDQLIIDDTNWGPGIYAFAGGKDTTGVSIKDPSTCYVQTQRDAAASQSLTSTVSATMTWSTANYLYDRRGIQSAGTFTIPADQGGLYHVDLDALFSGTAMSATASTVEFKVGGVTKKVMFPAINSTTTLQIRGSFDFYLNGSDAVTFVATITGTTPTFGNGTWPSNATIRRIA